MTLTHVIKRMVPEQQIAFGWAAISTSGGQSDVDLQGDVYESTSVLEDAVYEFILSSREGGLMHKRMGVGRVVESFVLTDAKAEVMSKLTGWQTPLGVEGWWVGIKVDDPDVWADIKSGKYSQFSVGGIGQREQVT